jgi:hypothetical protein
MSDGRNISQNSKNIYIFALNKNGVTNSEDVGKAVDGILDGKPISFRPKFTIRVEIMTIGSSVEMSADLVVEASCPDQAKEILKENLRGIGEPAGSADQFKLSKSGKSLTF